MRPRSPISALSVSASLLVILVTVRSAGAQGLGAAAVAAQQQQQPQSEPAPAPPPPVPAAPSDVAPPSGKAEGAAGVPVIPGGAPPMHPPAQPSVPGETKVEGTTPVEVGPQPPAVIDRPPAPTPPPPRDALSSAGYLPGYRTYPSLGLAPYVPQVGAFPGGVTPAFGAPMPPGDWTFRWSGFMSATGQFTLNKRMDPLGPGQSRTVVHAPPNTVDEYQSFVGTSTIPGQWVQMNFAYGNRAVSATVTLSTWNPTNPSTYYQIGSQGFINNAFLTFEIPQLAGWQTRARAGYLHTYYGNLGSYGPGMYQSPAVGGPRGVGLLVSADRDLGSSFVLQLEGGFMGSRNGRNPDCPPNDPGTGSTPDSCARTTAAGPNGNLDPTWAGAFTHHLHAGLQHKGEWGVRGELHYLKNWAHDDRIGLPEDNQVTREIDESYVRDGSLSVYGANVIVTHPIYGQFGVAGAHVRGDNAYTLKGLLTFGGDGEVLTKRWWGGTTNGTGTLTMAAFNYAVSVGKIASAPIPFNGDGPDLVVNLGGVLATTSSAHPTFDGRVRYKLGADVLYTFIRYMGVEGRVDRVVPTSKDSSETFHVLAAKLVFRTGWRSRESLSLLYARWFYGPNTHPEASSTIAPWLDDQLIAINVNMWW